MDDVEKTEIVFWARNISTKRKKKRKRKKRKVNVVPSPIDAFVNFSWEFSRLSSRDTHEAKGKNEIVKFVFKGTADVSNGNNLN